MRPESNPKNVTEYGAHTLSEAHSLITTIQDFFSDADGCEVDIKLVDLRAYPKTATEDQLAQINQQLKKFHEAFNDFDCTFHDLFGCL